MLEQRYKRTCFKIQFSSRKEAKHYVKNTNQVGKSLETKLCDVYYCEECLAWHTTSRPKEDRDFFKKYVENKRKNKQ